MSATGTVTANASRELRPASLRGRVVTIATFAAFAVGALIAYSATVVLDVRAAFEEERTVFVPAERAVAAYDEALREQERGKRGYVITADREFLEPYNRGGALAAEALAELRRLFDDDPELLAALDEVEAAHDRWVTEAAEPTIAAMDRGERDEAAATVAMLGAPRFEKFQDELADVSQLLQMRAAEVEARLATGEDRLLRLLAVAALAGVVIFALVLAALDRWVMLPVERLSSAVRRTASGDLDDPITVVGPREVVDLGADVEAMRLRILEEVDEMRRANEALAQQAPLVVGLRDVLLPAVTPPPSLELDSMFLPAEGVLAGDWFDVWTLDEARIGLVVADISGHGAEAGLFALRLKDLLVSAVAIFPQPGDALAWVADRLGDSGERFATIFLAVIDTDRGRMLYASAGHPVVVLAQPDSIVSLLPTGPLLGPFRARWETRTGALAADTVLVAYTDGLLEARSADGDEFGSARLLEVVTRLRGQPPAAFVDAFRTELTTFAAAGPLKDDVTLVACALASATTPPR